jgi:hypothetical protein
LAGAFCREKQPLDSAIVHLTGYALSLNIQPGQPKTMAGGQQYGGIGMSQPKAIIPGKHLLLWDGH